MNVGYYNCDGLHLYTHKVDDLITELPAIYRHTLQQGGIVRIYDFPSEIHTSEDVPCETIPKVRLVDRQESTENQNIQTHKGEDTGRKK